MDGLPGPVMGPSTVGTGTVERGSGAKAAPSAAVPVPTIGTMTATAARAAAATAVTEPLAFTGTTHPDLDGVTVGAIRRPDSEGQSVARPHHGGAPHDGGSGEKPGQPAGALTWATTNPPTFSPLVLVLVSLAKV
jgi:hypothetical protein